MCTQFDMRTPPNSWSVEDLEQEIMKEWSIVASLLVSVVKIKQLFFGCLADEPERTVNF